MKFFFSLFSLFKDKDVKELESFENDGYEYYHLALPLGVDKKKLIKAVTKLRNKIVVTPANICIDRVDRIWEVGTSAEVVDVLIDGGNIHITAPDTIFKGEDVGGRWTVIGGLKFHKSDMFYVGSSDSSSPIHGLAEEIREAWIKIQVKQRNIPHHCPNPDCESDIEELTDNWECVDCQLIFIERIYRGSASTTKGVTE